MSKKVIIPPRQYNGVTDPLELERFHRTLSDLVNDTNGRVATAQANSAAASLAALVTDFNALLAKLKTAGLMET